MTEFDAEKPDENYVHYSKSSKRRARTRIRTARAVRLRGPRGIDRQILSESEPVYEGNGTSSIRLPDDTAARAQSLPGDEATFDTVLSAFTDAIERELRRLFEFE